MKIFKWFKRKTVKVNREKLQEILSFLENSVPLYTGDGAKKIKNWADTCKEALSK